MEQEASQSKVEVAYTGNINADLAALQAQASQIDAAAAVAEKAAEANTQPTQGTEVAKQEQVPVAAEALPPTPVEDKPAIPKQFAKPDGTVNEVALDKALFDTEAKLNKFRQLQKELHQKFNAERNPPKSAQAIVAPPVQQQAPQPVEEPKSFAEAVELSVKQRGLGVTMEELTRIAEENAYRRAMRDVEGIKEESEWQKKERELRVIMEKRPELMTEETINALGKVIESNPYLQQAPNPWTAALKMHLGDREFYGQRSTGQPHGISPTPRGPTAPVAPVGPATIPQAQVTPNFSKMDPEKARQAAKAMKSDDLAKVLKSMGVDLGR